MSRYLPIIKKILTIILANVLFACVTYGLIFGLVDDREGLPNAILGKPVLFEDDSIMPHSRIEQVVSDGQRVYVLYESLVGVVQVYDYDGTYLYSMRLDAGLNGAFKMAVKDNVLYIRDPDLNIYVFKDGEFTEFLRRYAADAIFEEIPYSTFEKNTEGYKIRKGSVWRIDGETETCIVSRPAPTAIFQNSLFWLSYLLVGLVCLLAWRYYKKEKSIVDGLRT